MKSNAEKCHLVVSTNNTINRKIVRNVKTKCEYEKLLGVKYNHELTFGDHISELPKKASRKI